MTIQEKIRDAILGISKTEIEKTAHCTVPVRLEDGKTLTDKKWCNMSAWAGCKREEVAVYIDDTIMASCKKGVVFTAETMWFEETLSIAKEEARSLFNPLRYADIRDIRWSGKESSEFTIVLADAKVEVYASIYGKFYAEALKRAVVAAGYTLEKKAPASKKNAKSSAQEAEKAAEPKKADEKKALAKVKKEAGKPPAAEEKPPIHQAAPAPASTPAEQMTLTEVNARIAALEGELAALRARADAERQRKEEAAARKAAEEADDKKLVEDPVQPQMEEAARHLWHAMDAQAAGNMDEACRYFQLGAEAGDTSCMENLALIYSEGKLVPRDAKKALHWFEQSWLHGNTSFQFEGAQLAIEVAITEGDLVRAEEWVERAEQDELRFLDLDSETSIDDLRIQIAQKRKALELEVEKSVFSKAEAEEGYYCPACQKVCKPMAGYIDHVCPYCGKVNRCADLRKNKITKEDRLNMIVEDLKLSIQIAKGEVSFEPWDTNVPWNNDDETEELVACGMDLLSTIMSDEGERLIRKAYKLGNMEGAYRLALLHLTDWHREDSPVAKPDPVLGREAARAAAQKGHAGAIALCKVLKIPPEEKPAPTREQQQKLAEIKTKLTEIRRQHGGFLIERLKEKYYFLKMMGNTAIKEHEPLFMEWLDLVQQGEQLDDPYCIRELYEVTWSLMEHGFDNQTYYTSRMAELGNGDAMVLTGDNLSAGKGCKEDKKAALYYYRVAADMDAVFGIVAMAKHYYDEKNKPGCLYWARKLVENKFPAAYKYIAELSDDPEERAQAQAQIPGFRK